MTREASPADVTTSPQVFISYAREDSKRVVDIARLLSENGVTVWRD
jgi:hypothetical protein